MNHVILLGDSIFDNGDYVPNQPSVIEQLRTKLDKSWQCSLMAVDGDTTNNVAAQLINVPDDATHHVLSCGGNDALSYLNVLEEPVDSVAQAMHRFASIRAEFTANYINMLNQVLALGKHLTVCTIYDSVPGLEQRSLSALAMFNEIILKQAFLAKLPVIDLRLICTLSDDYSEISPIEPSVQGGEKITTVIKQVLNTHDFSTKMSVVFS